LAAALPLLLQGSNARLQTLDDALIEFLHFSGRWEEWLGLSKQAEEKALAANDFLRAGYRALQAGWIYHLHRQAAEVLACAARSEAHWKKARAAGAAERAAAIQLRGLGHRIQKDYAASIEAFKKALALDRAFAPESEYVSTDLNHLGEVEQLSGDHAAAKRHYSEALRISKAIGHREDVAKSMCNLAWLALDRKDWSAAESQARDSLRLSEGLGSQEAIGRACRVAAQAIARQGRRDESLPYARRATDIFTKLRMPDDLEAAQAALKECREGG
jgi:tetratricopeptide (TPR) repeat protein